MCTRFDGGNLFPPLDMQEEIEIRTREINEILGKTPSWLTRWGISIILTSFCVIFFGSCFFKYPDIIVASTIIVSENPPLTLISQSTGKIAELLIKNGDEVKTGDVLAIIENTANYNHVFKLKSTIAEFPYKFQKGDDNNLITFSENYILGPIQSQYSDFQLVYKEYLDYISLGIIDKKIESVYRQIQDNKEYSKRLNNQINNQNRLLELSILQYKRDSTLSKNFRAISLTELDRSEQLLLQAKNTFQNIEASLTISTGQVNQLNYQIIDLKKQKIEEINKIRNSLKQTYENLITSISNWQKNFVLISPLNGKVSFVKYWSRNQFVFSGDPIFTVVPQNAQIIIGRATIPAAGSGKVAAGQKVIIKLDNYPFMEYGFLEGRIENISLIPRESENGIFYTAEISLPKGLNTNYSKLIPFNQEMRGRVEIITNDLTVFMRIILPIKSALKKSF
jgi:multidrug resistance efflux pump